MGQIMKKSGLDLLIFFARVFLISIIFNSYNSANSTENNNQSYEQIKNFTEKYGKNVKISYDKSGRLIRIGHIQTAASSGKPEDIALSFLTENETLKKLLKHHPVVSFIGARQVGKTTLARSLIATINKSISYFDLENPEDPARLADPMLTLKDLKGLAIIDEVQRVPEIFSVLPVLVDRPKKHTKFLILGSASPALLRQGSETLAGRIYYHQ